MTDRARVLLVAPAGSYRLMPYIHAARALGVEPCIASEGVDAATTGDGLAVALTDGPAALARLRAWADRAPFAAVVATDDASTELAASLACALGLPGNPPQAARYARRKDLARARLAQAGLPVPRHVRVRLDAPLDGQLGALRYPVVIKPLALSGSRGVIRADDAAALAAAAARVRTIVAPLADAEERAHALVEEYLPGTEVALEGLLTDAGLQVLALFDKPDPLEGPYFEETYYVTPSRLAPDLHERVRARVAEACAAYGLRTGPVHAELRVHAGEAWLLEVAARTIGGQCARLLQFGCGRRLEEIVLGQLLGRALPVGGAPGAGGVLMIPIPQAGVLRRVEGVLAARAVPGVEDVEISVREGYELVPLPEGESYLGFIFARAPDPAAVEAALRAAHACLRIVVAPAWRIEGAPAAVSP